MRKLLEKFFREKIEKHLECNIPTGRCGMPNVPDKKGVHDTLLLYYIIPLLTDAGMSIISEYHF